ncbi:MAG TPA: hypothetical protein PKC32_08880, partial [Sphingopyxis sp.]|nr:hypothetical protein [Sphingopyxis sp.]
MPAALVQLKDAAAGRRGLPHLAIENYSQIQAKKRRPKTPLKNAAFRPVRHPGEGRDLAGASLRKV